jgi:hypothetical protein
MYLRRVRTPPPDEIQRGPDAFANAARLLSDWHYKTIPAPTDIDNEPIPISSVSQRAAQCRNMDSEGGRLDK